MGWMGGDPTIYLSDTPGEEKKRQEFLPFGYLARLGPRHTNNLVAVEKVKGVERLLDL